jgi:hypothetical protein
MIDGSCSSKLRTAETPGVTLLSTYRHVIAQSLVGMHFLQDREPVCSIPLPVTRLWESGIGFVAGSDWR